MVVDLHFQITEAALKQRHAELIKKISCLKGEPEDGSGKFSEEATALYKDGSISKYALLCIKESEKILECPEIDIEPIFNLIFSLLLGAEEESCKEVVDILAPLFTKDTKYKPFAKITTLTNLYNMLEPNSSIRQVLFFSILRLVSDNNEIKSITPALRNVEKLFSAWGVNIDKKRAMYLELSEILDGHAEYRREGYEFLLRYLSTFTNDITNAENKETMSHAKSAILKAVSIPEIFTFDNMYNLPAIQSFINKSENHIYKKFIRIYMDVSFEDYKTFIKENNDFLAKNDVCSEDCLHKIRLLVLCKIFLQNLLKDIPLKTLADSIDVDLDEITDWIIALNQFNLASIRIDQVQETALASNCTFLEFGEEQWKFMKNKLTMWSNSVKDILQVVSESRLTNYPKMVANQLLLAGGKYV